METTKKLCKVCIEAELRQMESSSTEEICQETYFELLDILEEVNEQEDMPYLGLA